MRPGPVVLSAHVAVCVHLQASQILGACYSNIARLHPLGLDGSAYVARHMKSRCRLGALLVPSSFGLKT